MNEQRFREELAAGLGVPPPAGPALARARLTLHDAPSGAPPPVLSWLAGGLAVAVIAAMTLVIHPGALQRVPAAGSHPARPNTAASPGAIVGPAPAATAPGASDTGSSTAAAPAECRLGITLVQSGSSVGNGYLRVSDGSYEAVASGQYANQVFPAVPGAAGVRVSPWNVSPDRRFGAYSQAGAVYVAELASGRITRAWRGSGNLQVLSYQPDAVYFARLDPATGAGSLMALDPAGAAREVTSEFPAGWWYYGGGFAWQVVSSTGVYADRNVVKRLELSTGRSQTWYTSKFAGTDVLGTFGSGSAVVGIPEGGDGKGPRTYTQLLLLSAPGVATPFPAPRLADFHATSVSNGSGDTFWIGATDGVWTVSRTGGLNRLAGIPGAPPASVYVDTGCR